MSLLKRSAAAAAALLMTLSLASCGKDTTWGAEIDGNRLRAGILIYYQSSAVSQAYTKVTDTEADILNTTIEDKPSKDWINDTAIMDMRKFAVYEKKFDELGLKFENNEDKAVSANAESWWEYLGEQYEEIGISKQTYLDIAVNSQKENAIFNYYYGEGGEKAVSDDEIKSYLTDNNARINYIEMTLKDAEGNVLKSEDKEDIKKMAEEYIERLKNGESISVISDEYNEYVDSLSASEEDSGTTEEEDGSSETETETETEEEAPDYGTVVSKDSTLPAVSVIEKVFSDDMSEGDYVFVEDYEAYYIVTKLDLFADPEYFENSRETALHALKDEEFDAMVENWLTEQNVVINQDSIDRYKLDKLTV